jgi:hypothetical protein
MARLAALIVLLAATSALGGCNYVYSKTPLFTDADAAGAPRLRPGVWVRDDPDCRIDPALPTRRWPKCAHSWRIGRNGGLGHKALIAAGDPLVLQVRDKGADGHTAYFYGAGRVTRSDPDGRATELSLWVVQCGPPPELRPAAPEAADPSQGAAQAIPPGEPSESPKLPSMTSQPLPGLIVEDGACLAREREPVRAAAKASEHWNFGSDHGAVIRWVQDRGR